MIKELLERLNKSCNKQEFSFANDFGCHLVFNHMPVGAVYGFLFYFGYPVLRGTLYSQNFNKFKSLGLGSTLGK